MKKTIYYVVKNAAKLKASIEIEIEVIAAVVTNDTAIESSLVNYPPVFKEKEGFEYRIVLEDDSESSLVVLLPKTEDLEKNIVSARLDS